MVDDKELAAVIAREIFRIGGEKPARIQFVMGPNPERPGVWFGEKPLADFIEGVLREHRSY